LPVKLKQMQEILPFSPFLCQDPCEEAKCHYHTCIQFSSSPSTSYCFSLRRWRCWTCWCLVLGTEERRSHFEEEQLWQASVSVRSACLHTLQIYHSFPGFSRVITLLPVAKVSVVSGATFGRKLHPFWNRIYQLKKKLNYNLNFNGAKKKIYNLFILLFFFLKIN
jgi:hypothetical protein